MVRLNYYVFCRVQSAEKLVSLKTATLDKRGRKGGNGNETNLKHQSNQNENHQAEDDVGVVLNKELLAEERVTFVPSAKRHDNSLVLSPLFPKEKKNRNFSDCEVQELTFSLMCACAVS